MKRKVTLTRRYQDGTVITYEAEGDETQLRSLTNEVIKVASASEPVIKAVFEDGRKKTSNLPIL